MPDRQISNPAGAYGLPNADGPAYQQVVDVVNNSGGTLLPGDVIVMTDVAGVNVTTTTTASDPQVYGTVLPLDRGIRTVGSAETYAAGAIMPVCVAGNARINIGANTVAAGAPLATFTTAKQAQSPAAAGSVAALQALVGSWIGTAQEAQGARDANNTIRAHIRKM